MPSHSSQVGAAKSDWIAREQDWLDAHLVAKTLREKADAARERWMKASREQLNESAQNAANQTE